MVQVTTPSFEGKELTFTIAVGLALVGCILAAVATGITWASGEADGEAGNYKASELDVETGFGTFSFDYSEAVFDDTDGVGLLRAGGPLLITGVVLGFVSMAAMTTSLFIRGINLPLWSSLGMALATLFFILATILLPIGIDQNSADAPNGISWVGGLYVAVFGTAMAIAATALGVLNRGIDG